MDEGKLTDAGIGFITLGFDISVAVDQRAPKGWARLIIGLAAGGAILLIAPLTGGSLNPARIHR